MADGIGGGGLPREGATASPPAGSTRAQGRGRAHGPGPALLAAAALALLALAIGVLASGGGVASSAKRAGSSSVRYGGLPSWLPRPALHPGRLLHASSAQRVLAIQGETVAVSLSAGAAGGGADAAARPASPHLLATAVGPEVPEEGRFPVPPVSPCTFLITFASVSRPLPLSGAQFTLIDERARVHHPKLTSLSGGPPPRRLLPGRPVTVKLRDILPTGDGGLSWAPQAGARALVTWDYTVEID
ncbi:MAG TPA: hypothetical protein VMG62_04185 [Solirubrobacteraceae bacterium]|nr:hypothetical protein [Solirubrobacteraceae bacterium]